VDLKAERESQFNRAGGSEFQVKGAAVLNDRMLNVSLSIFKTHTRTHTMAATVRPQHNANSV